MLQILTTALSQVAQSRRVTKRPATTRKNISWEIKLQIS